MWEEVNGSSFFTVASQYRGKIPSSSKTPASGPLWLTRRQALIDGGNLASTLGKPATSYTAVAPQILCFLQTFWDSSGGYARANSKSTNPWTSHLHKLTT